MIYQPNAEMVYRPVAGSRLSQKTAQVVGSEVQRLMSALGRELTNAEMLEAARLEVSPLHPYFPWDDHVAAEQRRLQLAGHYLNSIEIVIVKPDGEQISVRGFHPVTIATVAGKADDEDEEPHRGWVSFSVVRESPDLQDQVLREVRRQAFALLGQIRKYETVFGMERYKPVADSIASLFDAVAS